MISSTSWKNQAPASVAAAITAIASAEVSAGLPAAEACDGWAVAVVTGGPPASIDRERRGPAPCSVRVVSRENTAVEARDNHFRAG